MDYYTERKTEEEQAPEKRSQRYALLALLLLLLGSLGWGIYHWNQGTELKAANNILTKQADSLLTTKKTLEQEVRTISGQLETVRDENKSLNENLAGLTNTLAEKDRVLTRLKKENNSLGSLKKQVSELRKLRAALAGQLNTLTNDNQRLASENQQLREKNDALLVENQILKSKPEKVEEKPKAPVLRANSLRVEVIRRRDKLTVKARRVRKIAVIVDLPDELADASAGKQTIYVSLKDMAQRPLKAEDSRQVTVDAPGIMNPVTVHMSQVVDVSKAGKRLTFPYELSERLKSGIYSAELFTDKAFLGRVEFRLQ
nr:hypothetical protein [uncultured Arsenicibacter sp.]